MKKRLAVVITGWHYPYHFYNQMIKQKKPTDWDIDYYVIGHRDPKFANGEKNIKVDADNILDKLDYEIYKEDITIEDIEKMGWKYESGSNGCQWDGSNYWLKNNDYKKYDVILFSDDDHYIIENNFFEHILDGKIPEWFINKKINGCYRPEAINYTDDWLVISNAVQNGRQMIRGSFEFFKPEFIELMGGQFPLTAAALELSKNKKNDVKSPADFMAIDDWNDQCVLIMDFINENKLYDRFSFLSPFYRVSNYVIEGERGYIANNKCAPFAPYYLEGIKHLESEGRL